MERTKRGQPLWSATSNTVCTWPLLGPNERLESSWMSSKSTRDWREMSPFRWTRTRYLPPGSNSQKSNGVDAWELKRGRGFENTVSVAQYRSSLACSTTNVRSSSVERAVRGTM